MASINMDGKQSFLLNDIKRTIRNGGNVTHILNIKISGEPNNTRGTAIRRRIFQIIANNPRVEQVQEFQVPISWITSAQNSSAYYHSNNPMFTDMVVKEHTKTMLRRIINQIDSDFGNVFRNGTTGIAFMVTKPLTREIIIDDNDENIQLDLANLSIDDEDDEDDE